MFHAFRQKFLGSTVFALFPKMKFACVFFAIMAIFALFFGSTEAAAKVNLNAIKKGGKAIVSKQGSLMPIIS